MKRYRYNGEFFGSKYLLNPGMLQKQHDILHHYVKLPQVILSMTPNPMACKHTPNHILWKLDPYSLRY